jgi:hypothetical protein
MTKLAQKPAAVALTVAVIGHRPNRLANTALIKIRDELTALVARLRDAALGLAPEKAVALLTSLAEGADRLGAEAALALGLPLHVVLPLPREDFETDFANDASRADFRRLLAAATRVVELGPPSLDAQGRDRAYGMAAQIVLDHADLLIAIWDGGESAGPGGTTTTINEACARAIPVIVIDATGAKAPRLLWRGLHDAAPLATDADMVPEQPADEALEPVIARLLTPPPDLPGAPVRALRVELAQAGEMVDPLDAAYAAADRLAGVNAKQFRLAIKSNFIFAFFAIVLAVVGLASLYGIPALSGFKPALLCVEFVFLVIIVATTWIGHKCDWHGRWLVYREIAEYLRIGIVLRAVAARGPHSGYDERDVGGRFVRDQFREAGLPVLHLDAAGLGKAKAVFLALARAQEGYHANAQRRAHRAKFWAEGIGFVAFAGALLCCVVSLGQIYIMEHPSAWGKIALGVAAIVLPALGSASLGIRVFGDYGGVMRRSKEGEAFFKAIVTRLQNDPLDWRHLRARALDIAQFSRGELGHWRILAQNHPLDLPG